MEDLQPVDLFVVSEAKYEFVHNSIDTNDSTNKFQVGICRIGKDKMVCIERSQSFASNSSSHLFSPIVSNRYHTNPKSMDTGTIKHILM